MNCYIHLIYIYMILFGVESSEECSGTSQGSSCQPVCAHGYVPDALRGLFCDGTFGGSLRCLRQSCTSRQKSMLITIYRSISISYYISIINISEYIYE